MYLVSRMKKFFLVATMFMVVFGAILATDMASADATTSKSSIRPNVTPFPAGVLAIKETSDTRLASATGLQANIAHQESFKTIDWSWANELACSGGAGVALSFTTGICDDTVIGNVVQAGQEMFECGKDIQLCLNNWLYNVVGAGVSWIANGIITLATGTREQCIVPSGSGEWSTVRDACDDRIHADYFPIGFTQDMKLDEVIYQTIADQRRDVRAEMRRLSRLLSAESIQEERDNLNHQLDLQRAELDRLEDRTSSAPLSDEATVKELRERNMSFDVPKSAVSTTTWDREYGKYVLIGLMLLVPMIIASALQSVISGKGHLMLRAVAIHMPIAILGMVAAPWLVRSLMALSDSFSSFIIADVQQDVESFFTDMNPVTQQAMGTPLLLGFIIVALVFIFAGLLIWFVLSMREASVALISAFLPIALAASVWPALGKWAIRAVKLLIAAIISKIFIVGAISLGLGTFSGATEGGNISISNMVFGATIFFIAAFSPHLVMKFFDEIGDALNAAGGTGAMARGMGAAANANGARQLLGMGGGGGDGLGKGVGSAGGGGAGPLGLLAGNMAGNQEKSSPGSSLGSIGQAAGHASQAVTGGDGSTDSRAAAAAVRGTEGSTGGDVFNAAASQAADSARSSHGPGASTSQIAQEAGASVGHGARAEGINTQDSAGLAYHAAVGVGGSHADGMAAYNSVQQAGQAEQASSARESAHVARANRKSNMVGIAKGVMNPLWGLHHFAKRNR